jgi:hypothetical protein
MTVITHILHPERHSSTFYILIFLYSLLHQLQRKMVLTQPFSFHFGHPAILNGALHHTVDFT